MSLADRILVMYEGKVMDIISAADATKETLGLMMAGVKGHTETANQSEGRQEGRA